MNTKAISFSKGLEIWITFALSVFLLGYFFFPTTSKQNTFFYLGVCVPIVLLLPAYFKSLKPKSWVVVSTIVLIIYLFVNSLWSIHYSTHQTLKYLRYLFTLYCLFAAVFLVYHKKPNYSAFLFNAMVVIGFFYYLYGIWDHFNTHKNPFDVRYSDRPIDEAIFAGILILTCFWLIGEKKTWQQKAVYLGLCIPFVIIMLLSKSRGPQLALLITVPISVYFQGQNFKRFIILFLGALLSLYLATLFSDTVKLIFSRGLTYSYRNEIWLVSINESLEHFWFGQGASHSAPIHIPSGGKFNHDHNIILAILRMGGIVGVLLFSINLALCFYSGFKQEKPMEKLWVVWLLFGLLCHLTNGQYPLTRPTSLWFAYWLPIFFICVSNSKYFLINYKSINQ